MLEFTTTCVLPSPPSTVWKALIDPELVGRYYLCPPRTIEPREGGIIAYGSPELEMIVGKIIEFSPKSCLVHTFRFHPSLPDTREDPETTVAYRLEPHGNGTTNLTLTHTGFPKENQTYHNICGGWPHILNGLKTLLNSDPA